MCKQHQLQLPKTKATTTTVPTKHTIATTATTTTTGAAAPATSFVGCGLDRSCPSSVTTMPNRGVRLDQYQCNININIIRGEYQTNKRKRQKTTFEGCEQRSDAKSSFSPSNNRVDDDADADADADDDDDDDDSTILDHEFEWYDLDAIRGVDSGNTTNVIGHDFRAGLVFTTERQVLNRGAEANTIVTSVSSSKNDTKTKGQLFEFDLFFWAANSSRDHNKVGETSEDREFREQIEQLEQEIYSGDDLPWLSSSSSSLHW
jgi:hypothetical protein